MTTEISPMRATSGEQRRLDPEIVERQRRRTFTAEYRLVILHGGRPDARPQAKYTELGPRTTVFGGASRRSRSRSASSDHRDVFCHGMNPRRFSMCCIPRSSWTWHRRRSTQRCSTKGRMLVDLGVTTVLEAAHAAHPERFIRAMPQPPTLPTAVWINPPAKEVTKVQ